MRRPVSYFYVIVVGYYYLLSMLFINSLLFIIVLLFYFLSVTTTIITATLLRSFEPSCTFVVITPFNTNISLHSFSSFHLISLCSISAVRISGSASSSSLLLMSSSIIFVRPIHHTPLQPSCKVSHSVDS